MPLAPVDLSKYIPMREALENDLAIAKTAKLQIEFELGKVRRIYDEVTRQVESLSTALDLLDRIVPEPEPTPTPVEDPNVVVDAGTGEKLAVENP